MMKECPCSLRRPIDPLRDRYCGFCGGRLQFLEATLHGPARYDSVVKNLRVDLDVRNTGPDSAVLEAFERLDGKFRTTEVFPISPAHELAPRRSVRLQFKFGLPDEASPFIQLRVRTNPPQRYPATIEIVSPRLVAHVNPGGVTWNRDGSTLCFALSVRNSGQLAIKLTGLDWLDAPGQATSLLDFSKPITLEIGSGIDSLTCETSLPNQAVPPQTMVVGLRTDPPLWGRHGIELQLPRRQPPTGRALPEAGSQNSAASPEKSRRKKRAAHGRRAFPRRLLAVMLLVISGGTAAWFVIGPRFLNITPEVEFTSGPAGGAIIHQTSVQVSWRVRNGVPVKWFLFGLNETNPHLLTDKTTRTVVLVQSGPQTVTVIPLDRHGGRGIPSIRTFVYQAAQPPQLKVSITRRQDSEWLRDSIQVEAYDPQGERVTLQGRVNGAAWQTINESAWAWYRDQQAEGRFALELRASDTTGMTATAGYTVEQYRLPALEWVERPAEGQVIRQSKVRLQWRVRHERSVRGYLIRHNEMEPSRRVTEAAAELTLSRPGEQIVRIIPLLAGDIQGPPLDDSFMYVPNRPPQVVATLTPVAIHAGVNGMLAVLASDPDQDKIVVEMRIDHGPWNPCLTGSQPVGADLSPGRHRIELRARDSLGLESPQWTGEILVEPGDTPMPMTTPTHTPRSTPSPSPSPSSPAPVAKPLPALEFVGDPEEGAIVVEKSVDLKWRSVNRVPVRHYIVVVNGGDEQDITADHLIVILNHLGEQTVSVRPVSQDGRRGQPVERHFLRQLPVPAAVSGPVFESNDSVNNRATPRVAKGQTIGIHGVVVTPLVARRDDVICVTTRYYILNPTGKAQGSLTI